MTPRLHPDLADALAAAPSAMALDGDSLPVQRAARSSTLTSSCEVVGIERLDVTVGEIAVVVHRPHGASAAPGIVWVHGGGYVVGASAPDDRRAERWAQRFGAVVVQPRYRLAPEHPFPAALHDCLGAVAWARAQASTIGLDADRIGIGGSSAGGGLAAAVVLATRDRGLPPFRFQALVAPMLDDRRTTPSSRWNVPVWPPSSNAYGWAAYLGDLGGDDVPSHAAPARASDVSGLPPTLISVGAVDGFLDEDVAYAQRLWHAGVDVDLRVHAGIPHGIGLVAPQSPAVRAVLDELDEWIGRRLG
ncbi:MAG: alpha/beta hydrolase fold domain-containing protein [Acidimicrobiales bacterium]